VFLECFPTDLGRQIQPRNTRLVRGTEFQAPNEHVAGSFDGVSQISP
jgi:hypothetical protein